MHAALRLLPPTTLTLRRANKDTWLPSGSGRYGTDKLLIRKGKRVVISIYGAQRDQANFGEDASEFIPERWEHLSVNTPGFLAFSMGPRLCAGSKKSYAEITTLELYADISCTRSFCLPYVDLFVSAFRANKLLNKGL